MPTRAPWWAPPALALQFLTRIPVPVTARLSPDAVRSGLTRAVVWFPVVGSTVGGATATMALAGAALWPASIAVVAALIFEAWLTGAFHEDAVADFCDGFGGGRSGEDVRRIMKDSRIGSYGTVGLLLAVALRAATMVALCGAHSRGYAAFAIIAAATSGRWLVVAVMAVTAPAPLSPGLAKDIGSPTGVRPILLTTLAATPGLIGFMILNPVAMLVAALAGAVFLIWFHRLLVRRIGGSSGDCLGFAAYAGQLIVLLMATVR